jgi:hypothetical protein
VGRSGREMRGGKREIGGREMKGGTYCTVGAGKKFKERSEREGRMKMKRISAGGK